MSFTATFHVALAVASQALQTTALVIELVNARSKMNKLLIALALAPAAALVAPSVPRA